MGQLIGQLWNAFTLLEDRNEVREFLSKFFTPTEIQMLAKRLELLKLADSDLEVKQLQKWLGISRVTVYEWLDKHDAYEDEFHILIDRLKNLDLHYLRKLKDRIDRAERLDLIPKRTSFGVELMKFGAAMAYRGYKKRKKRQSALKAAK